MSERIKTYEQQLDILLKLVRHYLPAAGNDHENLAQDIWLYAWERGIPWTAQLVRWQVRAYLRKQRSRGGLHARLYNENPESLGNVFLSTQERNAVLNPDISEIDTEDFLQHFIAKIPGKKLKQMVYWRCKGLSNPEIAKKVDESAYAVGSLLSVYRHFLRRLFKQQSTMIYRPTSVTFARTKRRNEAASRSRRYAFDPIAHNRIVENYKRYIRSQVA